MCSSQASPMSPAAKSPCPFVGGPARSSAPGRASPPSVRSSFALGGDDCVPAGLRPPVSVILSCHCHDHQHNHGHDRRCRRAPRAPRAGPVADGSEVAPLPRPVPVRAPESVSLLFLLHAGSERLQPAAYALAHDRLRTAQVLRDVGVIAFVDHTRPNRVLLVAQRFGLTRASALRSRAAIRSTASSVETSGAMPRQHRARSSTRPRRRLIASLLRAMPNSRADAGVLSGPKAVGARKRRRERLGRQVGRDLRIADTGEEVAQHPVLVAAIESAESGGLATRRHEQSLVRRVVHNADIPIPCTSHRPCDQRGTSGA